MVSLDQYLDSQAAQAAADVIKIYKADFADSSLSNGRTLEQQVSDLEKIAEVYEKHGTEAATEEVINRLVKKKELPIWYYLTYDSKDVTFSLLKKLGIKDCQAFKEEVIRYCKSEGERPTVLNDLDDKLLESHFNSFLINYISKLRFNWAIKKAERKIKKLIRNRYDYILKLIKNGVRDIEAIQWQGSMLDYGWSVNKEIDILREKLLALLGYKDGKYKL